MLAQRNVPNKLACKSGYRRSRSKKLFFRRGPLPDHADDSLLEENAQIIIDLCRDRNVDLGLAPALPVNNNGRLLQWYGERR
jgi:hypothetical protein